MSRTYRRTPGDADFAGIFMGPSPERPYGASVLAVDGDRWMVVLLGVGPGNAPPEDPDGFLDFAHRLPGPEVHRLLSRAEPLEPPRRLRLPASIRRRYELMKRRPDNVIAIGDAICSFNPAYGQGMTVAAVEAAILRDCLARGRADLPKRYYREAAKTIDVPWDMAVGSDLRFAHVEGTRTRKSKVLNGYVARLSAAASTYPALGAAFLQVSNLIAPPTRLFAPAVLHRVLRGGRPQGTTAPAPRTGHYSGDPVASGRR
jgi:2-polyprenyl-6-methoxyphenol hydroxylase-like FAD-dependent oxidoreductase